MYSTTKMYTHLLKIIAGEHTALIQIVPADQIVKKGGNAYFDCVYEHADVTEWYFKDFGPMENTDRLVVILKKKFYTKTIFF